MSAEDSTNLRLEAERLFRWAKMLGDPKAARALTAHAAFLVDRAMLQEAETGVGDFPLTASEPPLFKKEYQISPAKDERGV